MRSGRAAGPARGRVWPQQCGATRGEPSGTIPLNGKQLQRAPHRRGRDRCGRDRRPDRRTARPRTPAAAGRPGGRPGIRAAGRVRRRPPHADPRRAQPAQRHPDQLGAAAGRPADALGRAGARRGRPLHDRPAALGGRVPGSARPRASSRWRCRSWATSRRSPASTCCSRSGTAPTRSWWSGCPRTRRCLCCTGWAGGCRCTPPAWAWCCSRSPTAPSRRRCSPSRWCTSRRRSRCRRPRCGARWPRSGARGWRRSGGARRSRWSSVAAPIFGADDRVVAALSVVVPPRTPNRGCWAPPSAPRPARSPAVSAPRRSIGSGLHRCAQAACRSMERRARRRPAVGAGCARDGARAGRLPTHPSLLEPDAHPPRRRVHVPSAGGHLLVRAGLADPRPAAAAGRVHVPR